MRCHGSIDRAAGLGAHAHALWAFEDEEGFRTAACDFLGEGLEFGQRLLFVADGDRETLREHLAGLPGSAELEERGALVLQPLADVDAGAEPEERLAEFAAAMDDALAAGFSGLRVVSDSTRLLPDPAACERFARLEVLTDRFMARNPLSALCCFDRRELPEALLGDLARLHPCANFEDGVGAFRVFAGEDSLLLDGEVDAFGRDAFNRILEHAVPAGEETTLDLGGVGFMDHVGVLALAKRADAVATTGGRLKIAGAPHAVIRMCDLVGVRLPIA